MKPRPVLAALVAAALLGSAGCGGGDGEPAPRNPDPVDTSVSTPAAALTAEETAVLLFQTVARGPGYRDLPTGQAVERAEKAREACRWFSTGALTLPWTGEGPVVPVAAICGGAWAYGHNEMPGPEVADNSAPPTAEERPGGQAGETWVVAEWASGERAAAALAESPQGWLVVRWCHPAPAEDLGQDPLACLKSGGPAAPATAPAMDAGGIAWELPTRPETPALAALAALNSLGTSEARQPVAPETCALFAADAAHLVRDRVGGRKDEPVATTETHPVAGLCGPEGREWRSEEWHNQAALDTPMGAFSVKEQRENPNGGQWVKLEDTAGGQAVAVAWEDGRWVVDRWCDTAEDTQWNRPDNWAACLEANP